MFYFNPAESIDKAIKSTKGEAESMLGEKGTHIRRICWLVTDAPFDQNYVEQCFFSQVAGLAVDDARFDPMPVDQS